MVRQADGKNRSVFSRSLCLGLQGSHTLERNKEAAKDIEEFNSDHQIASRLQIVSIKHRKTRIRRATNHTKLPCKICAVLTCLRITIC